MRTGRNLRPPTSRARSPNARRWGSAPRFGEPEPNVLPVLATGRTGYGRFRQGDAGEVLGGAFSPEVLACSVLAAGACLSSADIGRHGSTRLGLDTRGLCFAVGNLDTEPHRKSSRGSHHDSFRKPERRRQEPGRDPGGHSNACRRRRRARRFDVDQGVGENSPRDACPVRFIGSSP